MGDAQWPPPNLVHIALAELDRAMLTSLDGKRLEVSLDAICRLIADPPPMLLRPANGAPDEEMSAAREVVDALFGMGPGMTMRDRYKFLADCLNRRAAGKCQGRRK